MSYHWPWLGIRLMILSAYARRITRSGWYAEDRLQIPVDRREEAEALLTTVSEKLPPRWICELATYRAVWVDRVLSRQGSRHSEPIEYYSLVLTRS